MGKKLSAWCKNAKIEMINRDLKTTTLAKELDMNRSYVSSILNGRVYSAPAVKKISDYLGIADSDTIREDPPGHRNRRRSELHTDSKQCIIAYH